ncbi:MAG TPA: FtsX-like permease family protein [Puia sp.]|uniref:ABC transporter permease n=1 Tax=Puia sp. TaxID=2045100 RepID=UPI002CEE1DB4|nr:FtsX-like permease family protein [Puia sp.]HVU98362.1 FtsX-like permease family protein [Puia sp.]
MLKNYFKVALRNLTANKTHSLINVSGLAVGMAVALLIGFWIWDEVSYNRSIPQHDHIAQVMQNSVGNGTIFTGGNTPFPTADELRTRYGSDFSRVVIGSHINRHVLSIDNKVIIQSGGWWEPGMADLLGLKMVYGTHAALNAPEAILLSASVSKAYFGDTNPVGKTMHIDKDMLVRVSGVYQDLATNTAFADLHFIANWKLLYNAWGLEHRPNPWRMNAFITLVALNDNVDIHAASARIKDAKLKHVQGSDALAHPQFWLHPMNKWRLYSDFKNGVSIAGNIKFVWLFGAIGVFVLLLACINFMNLSTARSEKRAREVGIRKAIGSLRHQLILQFLSESLFTSFIALVIAILLVSLLLPFFNEVASKKITMPLAQPFFWLATLGFTVFTGLIAGSYPALYLSSFRPVRVLKGVFKAGPAAAIPRRVLTVVQFSVSIVLIIGTIVVFHQIQYAQDRPLGYNHNGLVMIPMISDGIHDHLDAVRNDLIRAGAITAMTESESFTTNFGAGSSDFVWEGKDPALATNFSTSAVAYDYGKTIGWQLVQGRDFSHDYPTDTAAFIINEAAVRFMGLKNPIGHTIRWYNRPYHVVGVVKDIIVESPYQAIQPFFYYIYDYSRSNTILRLNPNISAKLSLATIARVYKQYDPDQPFNYHFADEEYAKKFGDEQRIGKLAGFFAALAIFISCLGLFGMASFIAEQRTKEIGVRKVLGASVFNLWQLLSREFIFLVAISLLIAIPAATWIMHGWLRNYAYHASLAWWIFAVTALGALLITLFTVSLQAVRAALSNPVKSLRSE